MVHRFHKLLTVISLLQVFKDNVLVGKWNIRRGSLSNCKSALKGHYGKGVKATAMKERAKTDTEIHQSLKCFLQIPHTSP